MLRHLMKDNLLSIHAELEKDRYKDLGLRELNDTEKGPVKLIKQVKIANSFLQSVSNQFDVIILSLPM